MNTEYTIANARYLLEWVCRTTLRVCESQGDAWITLQEMQLANGDDARTWAARYMPDVPDVSVERFVVGH